MTSFQKEMTPRHEDGTRGFTFSNDGKLLATGTRRAISIWDPTTGLLLRSWKTAFVDPNLDGLAFSPDASLLATAQGLNLTVWDVATGYSRADYFGGKLGGVAVAFHPREPRLYLLSSEGTIKEWDLSRRTVIDDAKESMGAAAASPDGTYVALASIQGRVWIHDSSTGRMFRTLGEQSNGFLQRNAVAISPDSRLVASGTFDNAIDIWNVSDGRLVRKLTGHADSISSLAFSLDGAWILSGSSDHTMRVWDLSSGRTTVVLNANSEICSIVVSPDGHTIFALQIVDKAILVWDVNAKRVVATLDSNTHEGGYYETRSLTLSRDGKVLIAPAASGTAVAIWDVPNRRLTRILSIFSEDGNEDIASLAISPDGSRLAVGTTESGDLSVWDLRRGRLVVALGGHQHRVTSVAWTPDGTRLISSSIDKTARIWDSGSHYDHNAQLLVDKISPHCLLVEECVEELNADGTISDGLRGEAIRLATARGNASYSYLLAPSETAGRDPNRKMPDYAKALRRAEVTVEAAPWLGRAHMILATLQYRTGEFNKALVSAAHGMELYKGMTPDAHAVRALAYYRLHDWAHAKGELEMARRAFSECKPKRDDKLLNEAEAVIAQR